MTPTEWSALLNAAGALLTAVLVAVATYIQQRAQTAKLRAETERIRLEIETVKHEVTPNSGGSSHDRLVREIQATRNEVATVRTLQELQGDLIATHIRESTTDRAQLHLVIDARPWESRDR